MKPSTPSTFRSRTAAEDGKIEFSPPTRLRKAVFGGAPKQALFLLFSIAVLMAGGATALRGQSALDGFDPHANDQIYVVVVQPDGKTLIGGSFTSLSPNGGAAVTCNRIARLNTDGTVDTNFNPNASGIVYAIAVQADGQVLAGGDFTTIGGTNRNNIARLDAATGMADSFDPNANSGVRSIAVQSDGRILVGGLFNGANSIGGTNRNYLARLDASTGLADAFDPNADGIVLSIAVQTDGKVLAGGNFGSIGAHSRSGIARLDPVTGVADSLNPNANLSVYSVALEADGKILAAGNFTSIGGATRNRIARLDATTGEADSFDPNANNDLRSIVVQADGKVLVGGYFTTLSPNGGVAVARNDLARLNPDGTLDAVFDPSANGVVQSIAVQSDGKILAGGGFTALAPSGGASLGRSYIARLETDGRLDRTLDLAMVGGYVVATAVQPDGKILIGGFFTNVLDVARNSIARLNTDGTLDMDFNPNATNGVVYSIAVQADGKIVVCGLFGKIGGQTRNFIARLDATTGAADSFHPNPDNIVDSIAVQADGKILAGGEFTTFSPNGGVAIARTNLARLNTDGTLDTVFAPNPYNPVFSIAVQLDGEILVGGDFIAFGDGLFRYHIARIEPITGVEDSFDPGANDAVQSIVVQMDGKILAGGDFSGANCIGGETRNFIARLDPTTGVADSFNPNANSNVVSIAVQADGKVLAGGIFSGANSIGGQTRNFIARLDATTGSADSFDATNANDTVSAIALQADGKILAGGYFTGIGGQPRRGFARLSNDTAALQNLAVTQTAITWTHGERFLILSNSTTQIRGGASPQFTRVTFESSTNNLNYTFLGNGTTAAGDWTLTGLNLPTGQNLYIRARGYYRSGKGSESIQESVRNAFLTSQVATPPLLNIRLSANTNVVLWWATNFTGFTLEASTNLNTNVWSGVSPAPAVSGTNNVVTNAVIGSARFYRLRQ
jgi:uncharacterized delta-60 repeat protein